MIDTHTLYQTVDHEHLDVMTPEHNHYAMMLVTCADGRFFLESELGDWSDTAGVADPMAIPFVAPRFFGSRYDALSFAGTLVRGRFGKMAEKDFLHRVLAL